MLPEGVPGSVFEVVVAELVLDQDVAAVEVQVSLAEDVPDDLLLGGVLVGVAGEVVDGALVVDLPHQDAVLAWSAALAEAVLVPQDLPGGFVAFDGGYWVDMPGVAWDKSYATRSAVDVHWNLRQNVIL